MPLEGFDCPRPAPRAPYQAPKKMAQTPQKTGTTDVNTVQKANMFTSTLSRDLNPESNGIPRLNVVTNFSQPTYTHAQKPAALRRDGKETLLERRHKQRQDGSKDRLGSLRSAGDKSGLSPSDRELVIGLTISNPPASAPRKPFLVTNLHRHKSKTPEIIITPADVKSPWDEVPSNDLRRRRKPSSSVYSRFPDGTHNQDTAPPMPSFDRRASAISIETSSSISSWTAGFSDEDTLHRDISRPNSKQSQHAILRSNSVDTLAEKYRSQGWWNHIVSPFLDRNGTTKTVKSAISEKESPLSAKEARAGNWKIAKAKVRRSSFVHSIWADLTSRNIISQPPEFFEKKEKDSTFNDYPGVHRGQTVMSPATISVKSPAIVGSNERLTEKSRELGLQPGSPRGLGYLGVRSPEVPGVQGMGSAAEYFEAYWHDQNSPTPYFSCQNHVCSYGQKDAATLRAGVEVEASGVTSGSRGIEGDETSAPSKLAEAMELAKELKRVSSGEEKALSRPGSLEQKRSAALPYPDEDVDRGTEDGAERTTHIAEATAMPMTRAITPLPIDSRSKALLIPQPVAEVPAAGLSKAMPYPPDSPVRRGPPSPAAMPYPPDSPVQRRAPSPPTAPHAADSLSQREAPFVRGLPHPSESPMQRGAPSPGAMTPGMRADFAEDRALPMVPPAGADVPRYPVDQAPSQTHNPYSRYYVEESSTTVVSRTVPQPLSSNPTGPVYFPPTQHRGVFVEEINDSHPQGVQSAPTRDAEANQAEAPKKSSKLGSIMKAAFRCSARLVKGYCKKKQRKIFCLILLALLAMVLAVLVPVIVVALPRNDMPVQTAWLNISGYPPIPTGIATIVRPNAKTVNGCVAPSTMWSCALPKEQQASIAPNDPDQPNFRVEIRFENGTNLTSGSSLSRRSGGILAALRRNVFQARDSFTSNLFSPSPAPPSAEDQAFLGNTTDNNTQPFGGEATPFFMSFLDATQLSAPTKLRKRQKVTLNPTNSTGNSSDPFPNLANEIPPPDINSDGTAAAANLYPFPTAQPLMLYNRGEADEHYGFYTYFDRSIFLKSASLDNLTTVGVVPDDEDGGSLEAAASLRCTWAQTRFLVQIWTNTQGNAPLLDNGTTTSAAANSSANDFTPPGSFPYPVTVTMDRHGGDIDSKSIYCYGMDDRQHIIDSDKKFQLEDRAFGGVLVNPAVGLFNQINVTLADGGPGGIDGGSGGCSCQWQNFDAGIEL